MERNQKAFTLIELLVVITIIVVLLALLTPAMDQAIYQGELAVCGAQLKSIAGGSTLYAIDNNRRYFHRAGVFDLDADWRPWFIARPGNQATGQRYDDRPLFRGYISVEMMVDPLAGKVQLDQQSTPFDAVIMSPVALWAGFKYAGSRGMLRAGDRLQYGNEQFNILATDTDINSGPKGSSGTQFSSHPDRDLKLMSLQTIQGGEQATDPTGTAILKWVMSRWMHGGTNPSRGKCDYNYAFTDGAVTRLTGVEEGDDRLGYAPLWTDANASDSSGWRWYIPAN